MKSDVIKYMRLYLFYGESKEEFIEHLYHEDWLEGKTIRNIVTGAVLVFVTLFLFTFLREGNEDNNRISYLMELYELDAESYSDEEKEKLLEIYESNWEDAEEALDDVLNRYERWQP